MNINPAFLGHGIFTEFSLARTVERYRGFREPTFINFLFTKARQFYTYFIPEEPISPSHSADDFIKALQYMHISSVWIQLFTRSGMLDSTILVKGFIDGLRQANVRVAGWGYCAGANWQRDLKYIEDVSKAFSLDAFVIDVEPGNILKGNIRDEWVESDFDKFIDEVHNLLGKENIAISTWPVLEIQSKWNSVNLMRMAADRVSAFAPQAYWYTFPTNVHYNTTGFSENDYPKNSPESFANLVIDAWRNLSKIENPLIMTGQTYWEPKFSRNVCQTKVKNFIHTFNRWDELCGFNWYHAGYQDRNDEGAMSNAIIKEIALGNIDKKPFIIPFNTGITHLT